MLKDSSSRAHNLSDSALPPGDFIAYASSYFLNSLQVHQKLWIVCILSEHRALGKDDGQLIVPFMEYFEFFGEKCVATNGCVVGPSA